MTGWRERSARGKSMSVKTQKIGSAGWFLHCWCARVCVHAVHGWTADSLLRNLWLWPLSLWEWSLRLCEWVQVCKALRMSVNMLSKRSVPPNYKRKTVFSYSPPAVSSHAECFGFLFWDCRRFLVPPQYNGDEWTFVSGELKNYSFFEETMPLLLHRII